MKKRNTQKEGIYHFLIYKSKEGYVGICYETGFVDIWPTMEETKKHLENGVIALLKTVQEKKLSEKVLNRKPSIKYRLLYRLVLPFFARTIYAKSFSQFQTNDW